MDNKVGSSFPFVFVGFIIGEERHEYCKIIVFVWS